MEILDKNLALKIEEAKKSILKYTLLKGLSILAIVIFSFALFHFILDLTFHLGNTVRLIFFVVGIILSLLALLIKVILPYFKKIPDESIALKIEKIYPELKDRFISTLQFANSIERRELLGSEQLIEALSGETVEYVRPLDVREVVKYSMLKKFFIVAGLLILLVGMNKIIFPDIFGIWWSRLWNYSSDATPFALTQIEVLEKNVKVAEGESLTLNAEISGKLIDKVTLFYQLPNETWASAEFGKKTDKQFRYDFMQVNRPFSYYCTAGDSKTPVYSVKVYPRPEVVKLSLKYNYPEYTGLSSKEEANATGRIEALKGTSIIFRAIINTEVKKAELVVKISETNKKSYNFSCNKNIITGRIKIEEGGEYLINLLSKEDFESKFPFKGQIQSLEDRPPVVEITKPGREISRTPNGVVNLLIQAMDDFAITSMKVVGAKLGNKDWQVNKEIGYEVPKEMPKAGIGTYLLELSGFKLKSGDTFEYKAQAKDNNPTPSIGESDVCRVIILSEEDIEKEQINRMISLVDQLNKNLKEQEGLKKEASELNQTEKDMLASRAHSMAEKQMTIEKGMEKAANELNDLKNERVENKLEPKEKIKELGEWGDKANFISKDMKVAAGDLAKTSKENFSNKNKEEIDAEQEDIVKNMKDLQNELQAAVAQSKLEKDLAEIIKKSREAEGETKDIAKQMLKEGRTEPSDEVKEKIKDAKKDLGEAGNKYQQWKDELNKQSQEQPLLKNVAKEASKEANPSASMGKAQQNLDDKKSTEALKNEQEAIKGLEDLKDKLMAANEMIKKFQNDQKLISQARRESERAEKAAKQAEQNAQDAQNNAKKAEDAKEPNAKQTKEQADKANDMAQQARKHANQSKEEADKTEEEMKKTGEKGDKQENLIDPLQTLLNAKKHALKAKEEADKAEQFAQKAKEEFNKTRPPKDVALEEFAQNLEGLNKELFGIYTDQKDIRELTDKNVEKSEYNKKDINEPLAKSEYDLSRKYDNFTKALEKMYGKVLKEFEDQQKLIGQLAEVVANTKKFPIKKDMKKTKDELEYHRYKKSLPIEDNIILNLELLLFGSPQGMELPGGKKPEQKDKTNEPRNENELVWYKKKPPNSPQKPFTLYDLEKKTDALREKLEDVLQLQKTLYENTKTRLKAKVPEVKNEDLNEPLYLNQNGIKGQYDIFKKELKKLLKEIEQYTLQLTKLKSPTPEQQKEIKRHMGLRKEVNMVNNTIKGKDDYIAKKLNASKYNLKFHKYKPSAMSQGKAIEALELLLYGPDKPPMEGPPKEKEFQYEWARKQERMKQPSESEDEKKKKEEQEKKEKEDKEKKEEKKKPTEQPAQNPYDMEAKKALDKKFAQEYGGTWDRLPDRQLERFLEKRLEFFPSEYGWKEQVKEYYKKLNKTNY